MSHGRKFVRFGVVVIACFSCKLAYANNGSVITATPASDIEIDGDFSDWPAGCVTYSIAQQLTGDLPRNDEDFSGSFRVAYDSEKRELYFAVEIVDESHVSDYSDQSDSLHIRFAPSYSAVGTAFSCRDDAQSTESPTVVSKNRFVRQVEGTLNRYEVSIDVAGYDGAKIPSESFVASLAVEYFDDDRDDSRSYICWSPEVWKMLDNGERLGDVVLVAGEIETGVLRGSVPKNLAWNFGRARLLLRSLTNDALTLHVRTDLNGNYEVALPPGEYVRSFADIPVSESARCVVSPGKQSQDVLRFDAPVHEPQPLGYTSDTSAGTGDLIRRTMPLTGKIEPTPLRREFTTGDGFPGREVGEIAQSENGTIWLAAQSGLHAFDGSRIRHIEIASEALGRVVHVRPQVDGEMLWYGTDKGLWAVDLQSNTITAIPELLGQRIFCVADTHDGRLIVGTKYGAFLIVGHRLRSLALPEEASFVVRSAVADTERGVTWLGTDSGIVRFDGDVCHRGIDSQTFPRVRIHAMHIDRQNALWMGTGRAILRFADNRLTTVLDQSSERAHFVTAFAELGDELFVACKSGVVTVPISTSRMSATLEQDGRLQALTTVFADRDGGIWIGNGHEHLLRDDSSFVQFSSAQCRQVIVREDEVWFTCRVENSPYVCQLKDGKITRWELPGNAMELIALDGRVFIGTRFHGLFVIEQGDLRAYGEESFADTKIICFSTDDKARLWVSTEKGLFVETADGFEDIRHSLGLKGERVGKCVWHAPGKLRIASTSYGLNIYDRDNHKRRLTTTDGLLGMVYNVHVDRKSRIWAGTSKGLQVFSGELQRSFIEEHGLVSDSINMFVCEDSKGNIWAGGRPGISRVNPALGLVQAILPEDGVGPRVVGCAPQGDSMWLACDNGLFRYQKAISPPKVVVDGITTDRDLGRRRTVLKTTDEPMLKFDYHAISPGSRRGSILYRTRLLGFEQEWRDVREMHREYENLPRGDYEFQVQAVDRDFQTSEIQTIPVRVTAPFVRYTTSTVAATSLIGLVLSLVTIARRKSIQNAALASRVKVEVEEKLALAEQLRESQRLESLGTMAAGVAHDFNNSLQAISMCTELILDGEDDPRELVRSIQASSNQAAELTRSLLTFARRTEPVRRQVRIAEVLQDCAKLVERITPSSISTSFELADSDAWILADEGQIRQAVLNLCFNARDAMPEGGTIVVSTHRRKKDDTEFAAIAVRDSGTGIEPADLKRVFDPFFTRKPREKGTGLGLSIVLGIVKSHDAEIHIDSKPDEGTYVEMLFPAIRPQQRLSNEAPEKKQVIQGNQQLIVLADDQKDVRHVLARSLRKHDYVVVEASDGQQAIDLANKHREDLAAVVLDIDMPILDGVSAATILRDSGFQQRIVLVSGLTTDLPPIGANTRVLRKPVSSYKLVQSLQNQM